MAKHPKPLSTLFNESSMLQRNRARGKRKTELITVHVNAVCRYIREPLHSVSVHYWKKKKYVRTGWVITTAATSLSQKSIKR